MSIDKDLDRGDSRDWTVAVTQPQVTPQDPIVPIDITTARIVFTMKKTREDGGPVFADPVVLRKTTDDSGEIERLPQVDQTIGMATIHILPQDTEFLEPGVYAYDVRVTLGGQRFTIAKGQIFVVGDVGSAEDGTTP